MSSMITGPTARELTPEEAQERAEVCFGLEEEVKNGLRRGREAMWEVARALHEFDEANGWSALGHEKLGDWLADPEIGMSRSTYYRLIGTFRDLVVARRLPEAQLADLDLSKVDIVMASVKSGKFELDEALADVKELGAKDLRAKYIKRPDPAEAATTADEAAATAAVSEPPNVGTDQGPDDAEGEWTAPPENPTDDVPRRASEVAEPITDADVVAEATEDDDAEDGEPISIAVDGEPEPARIYPSDDSGQVPAPEPGPTGGDWLPPSAAVSQALDNAESAMSLDSTQPGAYQALRNALGDLIDAIKEYRA